MKIRVLIGIFVITTLQVSGVIPVAARESPWVRGSYFSSSVFRPTKPVVQESGEVKSPDSDEELFRKAEESIRLSKMRNPVFALRAERQLKELLERYPDSLLRWQAEEQLREVQERLAAHKLGVAKFYLSRYEQGMTRSVKGAKSYLREIVSKYPNFSGLDEVRELLSRVSRIESESEETTRQ